MTATDIVAARRPDRRSKTMGNRHRRLASLLISLIATSPMAMELEATNEDTIEEAKKSATQAPKRNKEKQYKRTAPRTKPSEIRKTRWKRFMKIGAGSSKSREEKARKKGKGKAKWIPMKDMSSKDS